jgi:hypothetical protein
MSLHSSMSHKAISKRIERDQTSGRRPTLRQELNTAYTTYMMIARGVKGSRTVSSIVIHKHATEQMADISEQLLLLDACEMGFIKPVIGGAVQLAGGVK